MRIDRLTWTAFRLPFRRFFVNARGPMRTREGLIVRLITDDGRVGLGEATPLPEFGGGTISEAQAVMSRIRPRVAGLSLEGFAELLDCARYNEGAWSSVRCALDTALCDLQAQRAGTSIARVLCASAAERIAVNATIGGGSIVETCEAAALARAAGFSAVKLKVGTSGSVESERERIAAVREVLGPEVRLRLDANGAWTVDQAIETITALEPFNIEYIEQPVPPGNPDAMRCVRDAIRIPVAADEDIVGVESARRMIDLGAADVLVIKPMMAGGLHEAIKVIAVARAAGVSAVVTTTIDAGIGTAAALHLAATLPPGSPACGLATGDLLIDDLIVEPLAAHDGYMTIPNGPGLGVTVDERRLAVCGAAPPPAP